MSRTIYSFSKLVRRIHTVLIVLHCVRIAVLRIDYLNYIFLHLDLLRKIVRSSVPVAFQLLFVQPVSSQIFGYDLFRQLTCILMSRTIYGFSNLVCRIHTILIVLNCVRIVVLRIDYINNISTFFINYIWNGSLLYSTGISIRLFPVQLSFS